MRRKYLKTGKKVVCVAMATLMMFTGIPFDLFSGTKVGEVYAEEESVYTYEVLGDDTLSITGYWGSDTKITIPSEIDGKEVTGVGDDIFLFKVSDTLTSVSVPASITDISSSAFADCASLSAINVAEENENYKSIDGVVFSKAGDILVSYPRGKDETEYTVPNEVTCIGYYAFYRCSNLTKITIPNSVNSIERGAFNGCSSLTEITIPNSVYSIGALALNGCSSLTEITINEGVYSIGDSAFEGCSSLTEITIPNSVYAIGKSVFEGCSNLIEISISENVASIERYMFTGCSSLTIVNIPKGVSNIDGRALSGCINLEFINVVEENEHYKSIDGVLFSKTGDVLVTYPCEKTETVYYIPDEVTTVGTYAFCGSSDLKEITIPEGVTSIGASAFIGCSGLTQIDIPNTVTNIGYEAFAWCSSLSEISLPEGVTNIGTYAFWGCSNLTEISIPKGVTKIGVDTFAECSSLTKISIPNGVISIDGAAFKNCSSLAKINIPEGVTSIGESAFSGCSNLIEISIPEGVTSIGESAFSGCSSLTEIHLPEGVTSIEGFTFSGCSSLKKISIPDGVTSIGKYAFDGCSSLNQVSIPEGVELIINSAFSGCISLKDIKLPASVESIAYKSIGYYQFNKVEDFVIYGYSGTAAEDYAKENEFEFISLSSVKDEETDIIVESGFDAIDGTINLQVNELVEEDNDYKKLKLEEKLADTSTSIDEAKLKVYDIKLLDENDNEVQPNGKVWVKLPCPEEYDGENCNVYHIDAEGNVTDMNAVYDDKKFVFETDHFSIYLITESKLITTPKYMSGDANDDGKIDTQDAVLLKKYLAGYEDMNINEKACDVNSDGDINSADAVILLKHLAGYEGLFD